MRSLGRIAGLGLLGWTPWLAGCAGLAEPVGRPVAGSSAAATPASGASADRLVWQARALESNASLDAARDLYRQAVACDPRRADAWERLGVLADHEARWAEAAQCYRRALKLQPGSASVYADFGYSLYLQRNWTEAEVNLRQALALAPEDPRVHNNLALVLARTDRIPEAVVEFRKGKCTIADAHANIAYALGRDGRWADARHHYELALAADASSDAARDGLQELEVLAAGQAPVRASPPADQPVVKITAFHPTPRVPEPDPIMLPPRTSGPER